MRITCEICGLPKYSKWYDALLFCFKGFCLGGHDMPVSGLEKMTHPSDEDLLLISDMSYKQSKKISVKELKEYILNYKNK